MSSDLRGKTGRFRLEDYPLIGKPFGKKFYYKDAAGQSVEMPYAGTVDNILGIGGFGAVYRLHFEMNHPWRTQMKLGQYGALKLLDQSRPEIAQNPEIIKRFRREGKLGLVLRDGEPNYPESLIKIIDCDKTPEGVDYLLMECVEHAEPLSNYVNVNPRKDSKLNILPLNEALHAIRCVVDAVSFLHDRGVYHRDVKPGNLLRDAKHEEIVKLGDFGLATGKDLGDELKSKMDTEEVTVDELSQNIVGFRGSVWYTSPEVAKRKGAFTKYAKELDVWSTGATAYALLAGVPPYTGSLEDNITIRTQIASYDLERNTRGEVSKYNRKDDVVFLKEIAPGVPWPINDWTMHCLDKDLKTRMRSEEMKQTLEDALAEIGYEDK